MAKTKIATMMADIAKPFKGVGAKEAAEFAEFVGVTSFMATAFAKLQGNARGKGGRSLVAAGRGQLATLGNRQVAATGAGRPRKGGKTALDYQGLTPVDASYRVLGATGKDTKESAEPPSSSQRQSLSRLAKAMLQHSKEVRDVVMDMPATLNKSVFGPFAKMTESIWGGIKSAYKEAQDKRILSHEEDTRLNEDIRDAQLAVLAGQKAGLKEDEMAKLIAEEHLAIAKKAAKEEKKGFTKMTHKLGDMLTTLRLGMLSTLSNIAGAIVPLLGAGVLATIIATAVEKALQKWAPNFYKAMTNFLTEAKNTTVDLVSVIRRMLPGGNKEADESYLQARTFLEKLRQSSELAQQEAENVRFLRGSTDMYKARRFGRPISADNPMAEDERKANSSLIAAQVVHAGLRNNAKGEASNFMAKQKDFLVAEAKGRGESNEKIAALTAALEKQNQAVLSDSKKMDALIAVLAKSTESMNALVKKPVAQIINAAPSQGGANAPTGQEVDPQDR